jgi:predicted Zn-dependent protease with MMP-like domain
VSLFRGPWGDAYRAGARQATRDPQTGHKVNAIAAMTRSEFEALVRDALALIPPDFRDRFHNVEVVVEDAPSPELLAEMGYEAGETLFGLYHGTPLTERGWAHGNVLPDRIVIYQQPLEDAFTDPDEMFEEVCLTLIHEAGHYFGLSEDEIEAIEDKFWYSGGELGDRDEDRD